MKNYVTGSLLIFSFFVSMNLGAQNLIEPDLSEWVAGQSGSTSSFDDFGGQNERTMVTGPYGTSVTVWSAASTATSPGSGMSGGWVHTGMDLATDKTYRIAYWMKSTGNTTCDNNAGVFAKPVAGGSNVDLLGIETGMSASYWPSIYKDELPTDKWILVVGYVYGQNEIAFTLNSGAYDPDTYDPNIGTLPIPLASVYNFKFPSTHATLDVRLRNDLWDCQVGEVQYSYQPRIEEVNGQEPTIQELLDPNSGGGPGNGGSAVWNTSGNDINYTDGNVGIGTTNPGAWKLAVGGKIRAEEVKVETGWADYVFTEGYDLPTLGEAERHIREKGHLINIPSAAEVEANGIELGEMNKLLLEKIEELTLYTLEQQKTIQFLIEEINTFKKWRNENNP